MTEPYLEYVDLPAPREKEGPAALEAPAAPAAPGWGAVRLIGSGLALLAGGALVLVTGNFVAAQFERAAWLGWLTGGLAAAALGLVAAGVWRELRGLFALGRVDALHADLRSGDAARVMAAARAWAARAPGEGGGEGGGTRAGAGWRRRCGG